jgi:hypothetical protein
LGIIYNKLVYWCVPRAIAIESLNSLMSTEY